MKAGSTKVVRCAIYTRVSTDQGLEQDFNSLDAQYEASQAYIRAKRTPAGRCYEPNTTTAASVSLSRSTVSQLEAPADVTSGLAHRCLHDHIGDKRFRSLRCADAQPPIGKRQAAANKHNQRAKPDQQHLRLEIETNRNGAVGIRIAERKVEWLTPRRISDASVVAMLRGGRCAGSAP